jgi:hypothetical protein
MARGYVDKLGAFRYKGHTIKAYVIRRGKGRPEQSSDTWNIRIGRDQFALFEASPTDTEDEIRERVKRWLDEHLPG